MINLIKRLFRGRTPKRKPVLVVFRDGTQQTYNSVHDAARRISE